MSIPYYIPSIAGGRNAKYAKHMIFDAQAVDEKNVDIFTELGGFKRRRGYTQKVFTGGESIFLNFVNTPASPNGGGKIVSMFRFLSSGGTTKFNLAMMEAPIQASDILFRIEDSGAVTIPTPALTFKGEDVFFTQAGGFAYFAGKGSGLKRFNHLTDKVEQAEYAPPTVNPIGGLSPIASGGFLSGTYIYAFAWYYGSVAPPDPEHNYESPMVIATQTATTTTAVSSVNITGIVQPAVGSGVTYILIYRTLGSATTTPSESGSFPYYFVGSVAVGTTTFLDTLSDTAIFSQGTGQVIENRLSQIFPSANAIKGLASIDRRIVVASNQQILYSCASPDERDLKDFESSARFRMFMRYGSGPTVVQKTPFVNHGAGQEVFHPNFFREVNPGNGELITALAVHMGRLVIFKENSIYKLYGSSSLDFRVLQENGDVGCIAPRSVIAVEDKIYFIAGGKNVGIWMYDGEGIYPISSILEPYLRANIDIANLHNAAAGVYRNMIFFSVPFVDGGGKNNKILVYDYQRSNPRSEPDNHWATWDIPYIYSFLTQTKPGDFGEILMGGQFAGIHQYDTSELDLGATTIPAYFQTKYFDFGVVDNIKTWRRSHIVTDNKEVDVTLKLFTDYDTVTAEKTKILTNDYAVKNIARRDYSFGTIKGNYGSLRLEWNTAIADFRIMSRSLYYDIVPERQEANQPI